MAYTPHRAKKAKAYLTPRRRSRCPSKSPRHNSSLDNVFQAVGGSWFKCWVWAFFPEVPSDGAPNAGRQMLPEAGAERTLEAVRCSAWLGAGSGTDLGIPPATGQERHSTRTPTPIPPPAPTPFNSPHHRIRADQVFHPRFP